MGKVLTAPRVSVIVPIADGRDDIDVTLAKLAIDRDFQGTEIIIASGAGAHERLSPSLRRFAEFYNLSIKLVPCPQAHDIYQAMDAGVRHASSDMLLLLSPSVLPTSTGWLSDLEWAYKTCGKSGMVSPTLLYEDFSIRFAGIQQISAQSAVSQYAGYSRDWLKGREIATVQAASTDCALIPRAAFLDAGGFSDDFVGTDYKGVDFCLKLRAAGHVCLWLPTVQLIALDETASRAGPGILAPDRRPRGPLGLRAEMAASPHHHPIAREHRPMTGMDITIGTSASSSSATAIRPSRWAAARWRPTTCSTASTICPAGKASISPASAHRSTATRTAR